MSSSSRLGIKVIKNNNNLKGETMICETLKEGTNCAFQTKNGCSYADGKCNTVVDKCENCKHIKVYPTGKFCKFYADPSFKWKNGVCNSATHIKIETPKAKTMNALKASKRRAVSKM